MLPCSHESEHTATHTHVADHSHTHAHVHRLVISISGLKWPILVFYSDTNTITSTTRQRSTIMTTRRVTLTDMSRFDVTKLRTKYHALPCVRCQGYSARRRAYEKLAVDRTKDLLKTYMATKYSRMTGFGKWSPRRHHNRHHWFTCSSVKHLKGNKPT